MKLTRGVKAAAFAIGAAITLSTAMSGAAAASTRPVVLDRVSDGSANGPVVVAIGDSIMEGHGLDSSQAWPALLAQKYGWKLANFASDGSGFVTTGDNGDRFADQVAAAVKLHPSIVIVSGSSNDLGQSDGAIATSTDATLSILRATLPGVEILAVSPVWNDTEEPAQLRTIDADVVQDAASIGALTLDIGQPLNGRAALLQADDVHPTVVGQVAIARAVQKALRVGLDFESTLPFPGERRLGVVAAATRPPVRTEVGASTHLSSVTPS